MKALIAALLIGSCTGLPAAAAASELIVGAVRDTDGRAVAGATITAVDRSGVAVGRDRSAADGTFAIDATRPAVTVAVSCAYCEPQHVAVGGDVPVIVFVHRYAALRTRGPTSDDLAFLPYSRIADVFSLVPFAVTAGSGVSDRGLAGGRGLVLIDDVSSYRIDGGGDPGSGTVARAATELELRSPLTAPVYGDRAAGGTFVARTLRGSAGAVDVGPARDAAFDIAGSRAAASIAGAHDSVGDRSRLAALIALPVAGGSLGLQAGVRADPAANAAAFGLNYATGSRRYETFGSLVATHQSLDFDGLAIGAGDLRADVHVRNRGPLGVEFGARYRAASAATVAIATAGGRESESAVYLDARRSGERSSVDAALALQHDDATPAVAGRSSNSALIGSVSYEVALAERFRLHLGVGSSTALPVLAGRPSPPIGRVGLFESSLAYDDARRVHGELIAYGEHSEGGISTNLRGVGATVAWQVAPRIALRGWLLGAGSVAYPAGSGLYATANPYADPSAGGSPTQPIHRSLLWLSYTNGVRVDGLIRNGRIEGDLGVPIGGRVWVVVGTARRADGVREATIGLRLR